MMGKDIFEDMNIDALQFEMEMEDAAKILVNNYGKDLTEADLLQLSGMVQSDGANAENILAGYCLEYYLTQNYYPERIDANKFPSTQKKSWWKFW